MIRTAVIGVGYLGRFHAQKYASLPNSQLIGIADPSAAARDAVAAELKVAAHADYRDLLGKVDAVSIFDSYAAMFALCDALLAAVVQHTPKIMRTRAERLEALNEAFATWQPSRTSTSREDT